MRNSSKRVKSHTRRPIDTTVRKNDGLHVIGASRGSGRAKKT